MQTSADILTLKKLKTVSETVLRNILLSRGSADGILDASFEDLVYMGFDLQSAETIAGADRSFAENEIKRITTLGGRVINIFSPEYPKMLKEIYDPPLCLYTVGDLACFNEVCIAIVGARKSSHNGEDMAAKLAFDLSSCGITVVSGFAYGIDIRAHLAAVKADGSTIAVLGSGFGNIYPKEHKRYIEAVAKKGCVITEFFMDEEPNAYNFPKRNRVISGLCQGVVVIEASKKSGSLITARLALEQGRDVFAVPASPLSQNNATNTLIRNGAVLVESYLDIIEEFSYLLKQGIHIQEKSEVTFKNPDHKIIYETLKVECANLDELIIKTNLDYTGLVVALTMMELDNHIEKAADGRYYAKNI